VARSFDRCDTPFVTARAAHEMTVGGECGGGQRGDRQRAAAGLEKFPAVQVCFHNPW